MSTIRSSKFKVPGSRFGFRHSPLVIRHWSLVIGYWSLVIGLLLAAPRAAADDAAESRLRETLRSTMLQLRDAQNQIATLQGAQADSDAKNKELTDQLALMKKHSTDDKAVAETAIAGLTAKAADQAAEIEKLKDVLGKWQVAYRQVHDDAGVAEAERAKLADDKLVLQRRVDYLEAKNVALFNVGNEILNRYEDFS